jgi:hypothetical protein
MSHAGEYRLTEAGVSNGCSFAQVCNLPHMLILAIHGQASAILIAARKNTDIQRCNGEIVAVKVCRRVDANIRTSGG